MPSGLASITPAGWPLRKRIEDVVHPPVRLLQRELAHCNPRSGTEIQRILALDETSRGGKLLVDLNARLRLAGQVVMLALWSVRSHGMRILACIAPYG